MKQKYKYERTDRDDKKLKSTSADIRFKNNKYQVFGWKTCFIWTIVVALIVWITYSWLVSEPKPRSPDHNLCFGSHITEKVCNKLDENLITGSLCLDFCVNRELELPDCATEESFQSESMQKFRYFHLGESTYIYVENNQVAPLTETLTLDDFKEQIQNLIMQRLNNSNEVQSIVEKIIYKTDANKDNVLNYQEANTLWMLLNNRATFYMLVLEGQSYVPRIKNLCGTLVELEEIKNHLRQPKEYSLFQSVFSKSIYWYKINPLYRLKIAIGIFEFYSEASNFNPNDDFGPNSLLLCSPIEESFGYTFYNNAKLINYDGLMTTVEALRQLGVYSPGGVKTCRTDSDCVLTDECSFKCDIQQQKCMPRLVKPHIINYCKFLQKFMQDDEKISQLLAPALSRCFQLRTFYADERLMYGKAEMPLTYTKIDEFVERRDYWTRAEDYSLLLSQLYDIIWEQIKLSPDPKKPKKATHKKKTDENEPTP